MLPATSSFFTEWTLQMNYSDLKRGMEATLLSGNATSQRMANLSSALNMWLQWHKKSDDSRVGPELGVNFETSLAAFSEHIQERGASSISVRDKRSMLRRWRDFSDQSRLAERAQGETQFQAALSTSMAALNLGITELSVAASVPHSVVKQWLRGAKPNVRSRPSLARVEKSLGLATGTLQRLALLDVPFESESSKSGIHSSIEYRRRLASRSANRYFLKIVPVGLQKEWRDLLIYKTSLAPILRRQEKGVWRLRPIQDATKEYLHWHCMPNQNEFAPTASVAWSFVSSFFGFLVNVDYAEAGDLVERPAASSLSLAHLSNVDLISSYLEFMKRRSGVHSGTALSIVRLALSLLHPETGYLTQKPEYARAIGLKAADWAGYCHAGFNRLKRLLTTLGRQSQIARKPFEPLAALIELDFPLGGYIDGIERLRTFAAGQLRGSKGWAVAIRDVALMSLLAMHPVRALNLSMMRFGAGGHLTQNAQGLWGLRFEPEAFKNAEGAAKDKAFDVGLPAWVGETLGEYLLEARPVLESPTRKTNLVFISEDVGGQGIPWSGLRRTVERRTRRFIPTCPGFGPHGVRHLVATSWLKTHPHDYPSVALLLHDKLETVLRHYGHVELSHTHRVHAQEVERMYRERLDFERGRRAGSIAGM